MKNTKVDRYFKDHILPPDGFMYADIRRELNLAHGGDEGGGLLAALGLVSYTEFMGALAMRGEGSFTKQFKFFFRMLGESYARLLDEKELDVYSVFRSGMVRSYLAGELEIRMLKGDEIAGISIKPDGAYLFVVEKYFEDFMNACQALYERMLTEKEAWLPDL